MKKITLLLFVFVSSFQVTKAQETYLIFNFAPHFPLANTQEYLGNGSGRGFNVTFHKMVNDRYGLGGEIGFTSLFEKVEGETFTRETIALSGTQFRYQNVVPIMVSAIYFLNPNAKIRAYGSLGAGVILHSRRLEMGIFRENTSSLQLGIRPEIGAIFKINEYIGINLSGKVYQSMRRSNFPGQTGIAANLGFVINNWK